MKIVLMSIIEFLTNLWYHIIYSFRRMEAKDIKKLHPKRKKWLEARNKKLLKKRSNLKLRKIYISNRKNMNQMKYNKFAFIAPHNFSIIDNADDTISYFNKIVKQINRKKMGYNFYFNLSNVTNITSDSIMYIIAIINNLKCRSLYKYSFYGNRPISRQANISLNESGFYSYVKSKQKRLSKNSKKVQITSGKNVDTDVAASICDFVNSSCMTKPKFTGSLYAVIIELMTNTVQHAYNDNKIMFVNHWYVFVENKKESIQFVFLDIGEGIAGTVKKRLVEKILKKTDSQLIESALKGENRTETGQTNRGKGLPYIAEKCSDGTFENLKIYSGYGCYSIKNNQFNQPTLKENSESIFGTLFTWEINKNNIKEEYIIDGD